MDGSGEKIRDSVLKKTPTSFHHEEIIVDDIIFSTFGCGMGSEV